MIPKLETISTRPVELTAPEFKRYTWEDFCREQEHRNRRKPVSPTQNAERPLHRHLDVTYENIEGFEDLRRAFISQKHLALKDDNWRVEIGNVRIVERAVCTECGGFIDLFNESHTSNGVAERQYFHIACWNAREAEYARLEDEGE